MFSFPYPHLLYIPATTIPLFVTSAGSTARDLRGLKEGTRGTRAPAEEKTTKGRITKKGNSHLRKALYMPALSACRTNNTMKLFYTQLNERQKAKKQGVIAVQRKLLLLTYSLWKSGQEYLEKCA